jgi:hypothetical protein
MAEITRYQLTASEGRKMLAEHYDASGELWSDWNLHAVLIERFVD